MQASLIISPRANALQTNIQTHNTDGPLRCSTPHFLGPLPPDLHRTCVSLDLILFSINCRVTCRRTERIAERPTCNKAIILGRFPSPHGSREEGRIYNSFRQTAEKQIVVAAPFWPPAPLKLGSLELAPLSRQRPKAFCPYCAHSLIQSGHISLVSNQTVFVPLLSRTRPSVSIMEVTPVEM